MNYYNEIDPFAAQWLKNLIDAKLIPYGDVDDRSIADVSPNDLTGYTQCHFFAGVGGWSYALELAEWRNDCQVWTGSPPCQPFSTAGKQSGVDDDRHLWPEFFRLIGKCKPPVVFGEQVSGTLGREWVCDVRHDVESSGYSFGAAFLPACSVGAAHIRERAFWVAYIDQAGRKNIKRRAGQIQKTRREIPVANSSRHGIQRRLSGPGMVRVVHGVSANPRAVCAYGNAIVPQVAAEFIKAFMEYKDERR